VDPDKAQRILLNLLSNAFKFTPDAGRVRCELRSEDGRAVLTMEDPGPGVPEALREAVFERFRQAEGGREAVEQVEEARPDVAVMDVSMPRMDGAEATRIIPGRFPEVRVIGLSMHNDPELDRAMREAGATAYLTKGGPASELIEAIRGLAGRQPTG
jgi:DNA-binding NarL/FixJ family response regulator